MRLAVLGSGSSGNALVVESAGRRLLVDAGFSRRQVHRRLRKVLATERATERATGRATVAVDDEIEAGVEANVDAGDPRYQDQNLHFDAMLLTHEHGDHVKGVEVLARRCGVDVWATRGTLDSTRLSDAARQRAHVLRSGEPVEVAGFQVEPFTIPHDAREPVGFVIEDASGSRLALVADLGARTRLAWSKLRDLDALVLETNHDLQMLRNGPYPWSLKQRVASRHGHLSNADAALGVQEALQDTGDRLRLLVCYHLSRTNNDPALAADVVGETLDREASAARVVVTAQDEPTPWLDLPAPITPRPAKIEPTTQLSLFG